MSEKFFKVDLHIHTPASNCYKGPKTDEEYLNILKQAKAKDIKVIAITDHNSIEGYRSLMRIKQDLTTEYKALKDITDSDQTIHKVTTLQRQLSLYDDILILPGVEFEVRNPIHLLVIFNNAVSIDRIQTFLANGGYQEEAFGKENPPKFSTWDIFALFEESKKYDCIVIDAHTDSDKGILNTIPKSVSRANCFKSPQLYAVCYNNEVQKDQLKSTIQNAPEYKRDTPLAFVKFSDAHTAEDVGVQHTWVKLENINFPTLKKAFSNPIESISIEAPSTEQVLDKLINDNNCFYLPDFSAESMEKFKRIICALHNSDGGFILFGVTERKNRAGISVPQQHRDEYKKIVDANISNHMHQVEGPFAYNITVYALQAKRIIISAHIPRADNLITVKDDGRVYVSENGKIKTLLGKEVQYLIEERATQNLESRIRKHLTAIEKDCSFISNVCTTLLIMRKFEQRSAHVQAEYQYEAPVDLEPVDLKKISMFSNGKSKGNLFYFTGLNQPRLPKAYLRYSVPTFNATNSILPEPTDNETIYILPGGAVYYAKRDYPFSNDSKLPVLKLHMKSNSRYSNKFVAAFLKSSFFLWYYKNKYDDLDILQQNAPKNILLPVIDFKSPICEASLVSLEEHFDNILKLEQSFLANYHLLKKDKTLAEYTDAHNDQIAKHAYQIDQIIFSLLNLTTDEINTVIQNLKLNDIYIPS